MRHGGPRFPNNPRVFTLSRHLARALLHFVNICKLIILLRGSGPLPEREGEQEREIGGQRSEVGMFRQKNGLQKNEGNETQDSKKRCILLQSIARASRSRYRTMQKSRQERCSFDSWLRAGLHLHAPGPVRLRTRIAYLNMHKQPTAARVMCLLSMTYDNALPFAPPGAHRAGGAQLGDKRPSATTATRKRVPRRRPPLPEGEGKLGSRKCHSLDRNTDDKKTGAGKLRRNRSRMPPTKENRDENRDRTATFCAISPVPAVSSRGQNPKNSDRRAQAPLDSTARASRLAEL